MIADLKPYDEYRIDGPIWCNRIPSHWETVRNGRLFLERNQTGFAELPVLEVSLRTGVRVRDMEAGSRKQVMSDFSKYKRAKRGDIAYNMMRMWQGAIGIAPTDGLVSPAYVVAKPFPEVSPSYYSALFRTDDYKHQIDAFSRGIVKDRNRLYWDAFKQMPSLRPPSDEQALIVRFLDWASVRLGKAIAAKRKVIGLLEEQKQAIIHRAVTRGLNENVPLKRSGLDWLGDVPEHWEVWRISRFARVGNGSTPSRAKSHYWTGGTIPWLNSSQVNRGVINSADQFVTKAAFRECHLPMVQPGSLLIAITGQGKTRGTAAILTIPSTINQHVAYITPRHPLIDIEFLQLAFTAGYSELRRLSDDSGSTKGALTCEDLKRFKVSLPDRREQALLVTAVQDQTSLIKRQIETFGREIVLLREYQTRLISDVVTGKLDVREVARSLPADVSEEAAELAATESADEDFATDDELIEEAV